MASNYSAELHWWLKLVIDVSFVLTNLLLPVILFLVLRKSRQMKVYRHYILAQVIFDYIYHIFAFIAKPLPLFPSYCLLIDLAVPLPRSVVIFCFYLTVLALTTLDLCVVGSLLYRWSQAFPGRINQFIDNGKRMMFIYGVALAYAYVGLTLSLQIGLIADEQESHEQFLRENPDLSAMIGRVTIVCLINNRYSRWDALFVACGLVAFGWMGLTLWSALYVQMRRTRRESAVESTYRMQFILFRALSVQLWNDYLLLLLPNIVAAICIFADAPAAGWVSGVSLALFSCHAFTDYCAMLYFITPYRRTILSWVGLRKDEQFGSISVTSNSRASIPMHVELRMRK
ncbi:hypothetical protein M3Y99_00769900 [Aphelenchoides fujianensis]|nr:hypothetical protein M3Y99_00769900 [Aphelenchoides fujianensis]